MKVRALQICFVGGILRKPGDVFNVPNKQPLKTGKLDPVLEKVTGKGSDLPVTEPPGPRVPPGQPEPVDPDPEQEEGED